MKMKFVHVEKPGDPSVLEITSGDAPEPGPGEILIRVRAAGVNRPDVFQRKGAYPPPADASPILGLEVAGEITALGSRVSGWKIGDRVCALVHGGGYAEFCVAPVVQCLPIPESMGFELAAGIPETFFTVWFNVFMRGNLQSGETLLIHGGSSGIGTAAIQLARAFGARVFVTAGSDAKCQACLELGAEGAVNYKTQDFPTEIRRLNSGNGIDVILDMIGGDYFPKNVELLARNGRLVQISTQKGERVELSLRTLMQKCGIVTGTTLRPQSVEQKGRIGAEIREKVLPLLASGKIRIVLDQVFPFEKVVDAHRRMESSEHIGKIILKL